MFKRLKEIIHLRYDNKLCIKRVSFLFKRGYYIFSYDNDKVYRLSVKNIRKIGLFKSLLFLYHISGKGPKQEELTSATIRSGTAKHAVISDSYCYLVFKQPEKYLLFKNNYFDNIEFFNYPAIRPISYNDDLLYVIEPVAKGRTLTDREIPKLLLFLLELFKNQQQFTKDENGVIYYVQHNDTLPGNVLTDEKGSMVFIDLDGITNRPALFDFFNTICRTQGFGLLLKSRETFSKELKDAFNAHNTEYSERVYDLYLSKFVEIRLNLVKSGYNNGILYKSVEWIFDPIAEDVFPLTHNLIGNYKFKSTPEGYKVI